jgi:PIN domain nuclease of toxin-antitoxin system
MQIKIAIGRLKLSLPLQQLINEQLKNGFPLIPIPLEHIYRVATLPHIHNDPFDRLLIAQAIDQDITLITSDSLIQQYGVKTVW